LLRYDCTRGPGPRFRVLFLRDARATTGSDSARFQESTLDVIDGLFAEVLTVEELLQKITHPVKTNRPE